MIQDSGSRRKFETGAVRDVTEGKEKRRKARSEKDGLDNYYHNCQYYCDNS